MKPVTPEQRITNAEKQVKILHDENEIKQLSDQEKEKIAQSYDARSKNRLETASLIFLYCGNDKKNQTNDVSKEYQDYGEVVAASYYAMFYVFHGYLAKMYGKKLKDDIYQVHAKTNHLVLYYLVKTRNLATQLYEEYLRTMTTAKSQKSIEDFQDDAFYSAQKYNKSKEDRETSTYNVGTSIDERRAKEALKTAQEFIATIRQLMTKDK